MGKIGGNILATVLKKDTSTKNEIGEAVLAWKQLGTVPGWLDLQSGDSKHTSLSAKIQESTHVFLCDYAPWWECVAPGAVPENTRFEVNGKEYEVLLIDDPMEMHEHIEVFLKFVGGANNG